MTQVIIMNSHMYTSGLVDFGTKFAGHSDLMVSSSQAKIDENFANYFLNTKANNKCFKVDKFTCTEKHK